MKEIALLFGAVLVAIGLYAYNFPAKAVVVDTNQATSSESGDVDGAEQSSDEKGDSYEKGKTSPTALIPAVIGGLFVILGVIGFLGEAPRKHAMHFAATVGSLGALAGLGRGLAKLGALFGDDPTAKRATMITLVMGILCLIYVVLSVRSFIAARKAREAAEAAQA